MKKEKNRQRKKQIKLYVTEEEYKNIILKMKQSNFECFSSYARKQLIDGYVLNLNSSSELLKLIYEINKIGVNINQLTKLANENRNISKSVINQIARTQENLRDLINEKVGVIFGTNKIKKN